MICDKLDECCSNENYVCANQEKCIVYKDCRKNAVCQERNKRYNLVNEEGYGITLYHVDGGVISDESDVQKCDFLYVVYDQQNPTAIFVELKGKDVYHAIRQIKEMVDRYGTALQRRICARIVCSSVPRLYNDPCIKKLKKELMSRYHGTLRIFEKSKDEKYAEL